MYKSQYKSNIVPNDLSIQDKAYLAGILDGEGNISLLKNRSRNPRVRVQIANTDYRLIDWLISKTGVGNINTRPGTEKHKTAYTWICNNELAILILQQIRDYLVIKQDRCDLAIKASNLLNEFQDREDFSFNMEYTYNQMKMLNKKGPI
ncbi:MAG: hypothetical protein HC874_30470 [Richelia sp. SL_2_1]|nr:hypothetical protein [Richelia sp. SL_2_1]